MDLTEASRTFPPDWFEELKLRPNAKFVQLAAEPVTLFGKKLFTAVKKQSASGLEDHVVLHENAVAECGCGAKRSALAKIGEEALLETQEWIGWLCEKHAQVIAEQGTGDVVFVDGDDGERILAGTARELLSQFSVAELEEELRRRHEG